MFHACNTRFDVTRNVENFWFAGELNNAAVGRSCCPREGKKNQKRYTVAEPVRYLTRFYHHRPGHPDRASSTARHVLPAAILYFKHRAWTRRLVVSTPQSDGLSPVWPLASGHISTREVRRKLPPRIQRNGHGFAMLGGWNQTSGQRSNFHGLLVLVVEAEGRANAGWGQGGRGNVACRMHGSGRPAGPQHGGVFYSLSLTASQRSRSQLSRQLCPPGWSFAHAPMTVCYRDPLDPPLRATPPGAPDAVMPRRLDSTRFQYYTYQPTRTAGEIHSTAGSELGSIP